MIELWDTPFSRRGRVRHLLMHPNAMAIAKSDKRPRFPVPHARLTHLCRVRKTSRTQSRSKAPSSGPPRLVSTPFDQQLIRITTGLLLSAGRKDWYRS